MNLVSNIIAIYGVPRSGTSWLGQIFNSSPDVAYRFQPLFSYAYKDRLNETSSLEDINRFLGDILLTTDDFVLQRGDKKISQSYPEFSKSEIITHLVYKEVRYHHILKNLIEKKKDLKVIGIIRHPCSVINSWLKAPKEFKKEWNPLDEWRSAPSKNMGEKEEFNGFEKWKEVSYMFLDFSTRYPNSFYLLKYIELNNSPLEVIDRLFKFCNLFLEEQTLNFIKESTQLDDQDPYGVFRKTENDDKWKAELDSGISEEILTEIKNTPLELFLN